MNKLENLKRVLSTFREDLWLPFEDSIGCINVEIDNGTIKQEKLKEEFNNSINNSHFNWLELARETQLLISPDNYSNIEICKLC